MLTKYEKEYVSGVIKVIVHVLKFSYIKRLLDSKETKEIADMVLEELNKANKKK